MIQHDTMTVLTELFYCIVISPVKIIFSLHFIKMLLMQNLRYTINCLKLSKQFHTKGNRLSSIVKWYKSLWTPPSAVGPPYSHVVQLGDPILRQKANPVPEKSIKSEEMKFLIDLMIKILRKYDCVGLAAPQIGIPLRIIILEFSEEIKKSFSSELYKVRQMETLPLTVFINPSLTVVNYNKRKFVESCASVSGYTAEVSRYESVTLEGYNESGDLHKMTFNGWNARIAQHEMDHLNGTLYTDIMDRLTFKCSCWEAVNFYSGRVEIPFYPSKKFSLLRRGKS